MYGWFFGVSTMFAIEARYIGWKAPAAKQVPVQLMDVAVSTNPAKKMAAHGYEFEIPWEVNEEKSKPVGNSQVITLRSGNAISVMFPPAKEFVKGIRHSGFDRETFQQIYGSEPLQSDYAMYSLMLSASPKKVTPFSPRKQAVGTAMMLLIKGIAIPSGAETGIYFIQANGFKGFQYGDPLMRPRHLAVELLDENGGIEFGLYQNSNGSVPPLTQPEINQLIHSVRRISTDNSSPGG
jgi:hypothetical protein